MAAAFLRPGARSAQRLVTVAEHLRMTPTAMPRRQVWTTRGSPLASATDLRRVAAVADDSNHFYALVGGERRSYWHDLPHRWPASNSAAAAADTAPLFTFVNEIPKKTRAKMEVHKKLAHNPIVQDVTKTGDPRFYAMDIHWNYGCIPATYEDPERRDERTQQLGDGDPIDVVEIGQRAMRTGEVGPIKVLGSLALIDDGETDWKVIAISADDDLAGDIQSVDDIPEVVDAIRTWFRDYKIPDGKPPNVYAFDGRALGRDETLAIIQETHEDWLKLVS